MNYLIRCDSGIYKGAGHLNRCMSLAYEITNRGHKVYFVCKKLENNLNSLINKYELIEIEKEFSLEEEIVYLKEIILQNKIQIGIFDNYDFNINYYRELYKNLKLLVCIDDIADNEYYCDILINQNISANIEMYKNKVPEFCELLLGNQYVMLREQFLKYQINKKDFREIKKILITQGAGDSRNQTLKILKALTDVDLKEIKLEVILGGAFPFKKKIYNFLNQYNSLNINVKENVNDMVGVMSKCQLALCAGGSTCWELAYLGIPMIISILDDNQQAIADYFEKNKLGVNLGWYEDITEKNIQDSVLLCINNIDILNNYRKKIFKIIDGNGSKRIMEKIYEFIKSK